MADYPILESLSSPGDLKSLRNEELTELCAEIRRFLVSTVLKTGGHLASNLGVTEISVALLYCLDTTSDRLVYDVGHQCYVHKLLTGRMAGFTTLRSYQGLSGFPWPGESEHDHFVAGHASNSISAALGMARAAQLDGRDITTVAVIGDGAMTGGMAYEALNDAGAGNTPLIVIINDNGMSINRNVGAVSGYLSRFRLKKRYLNAKKRYHRVLDAIPFGGALNRFFSAIKRMFKKLFLQDTMFDHMGFEFLGTVDGHDVSALIHAIEYAKTRRRPVVIHAITEKGRGYKPSEASPGAYHGVPRGGMRDDGQEPAPTFSSVFGDELTKIAGEDDRVCAVTAAMVDGTGLVGFSKQHPNRFFDVGIAEEHAVTMCAGLAKGGKRPVFAVYSTFLQRSFDQLVHDVSILRLPVVFAIDRAGLCGDDGVTHHGIYDVGLLTMIRGITVYAPSNFAELRSALRLCMACEGPSALRYPKGGEARLTADTFKFHDDAVTLLRGGNITIVSYGTAIDRAVVAADELRKRGVFATVIKLNRIIPVPYKTVAESVASTGRLAVIEDAASQDCVGETLSARLAEAGVLMRSLRLFNCGDGSIAHGSNKELMKELGIDSDTIVDAILGDFGR